MAINSCLYEVKLTHSRLEPKNHRFQNQIFMFYLDLDEMDLLAKRLKFFSRNRFNLYNFRDTDHLDFGQSSVKQNLLEFVKKNGLTSKITRVMLLTHLRTLGHLFNPVSFYFCFGERGEPICLVPEVGNTFGELKPFFLGPETLRDGKFQTRMTKYYYISPFIDLDAELDFCVSAPLENLDIQVNDFKDGRKFFLSTMTGFRRELTDKNLLGLTLRYPLVTLRVISLIHWHAMRLYLKRLPVHNKEDHPELQRGVQREYRP